MPQNQRASIRKQGDNFTNNIHLSRSDQAKAFHFRGSKDYDNDSVYSKETTSSTPKECCSSNWITKSFSRSRSNSIYQPTIASSAADTHIMASANNQNDNTDGQNGDVNALDEIFLSDRAVDISDFNKGKAKQSKRGRTFANRQSVDMSNLPNPPPLSPLNVNNSPANKSNQASTTTDNLAIEEGTPAMEALEANAEVHVTRLAKFSRYIHAHNVKRLFVKAPQQLVGVSHFGSRRGKPPRVPEVDEKNTVEEMVNDSTSPPSGAAAATPVSALGTSSILHPLSEHLEEDDSLHDLRNTDSNEQSMIPPTYNGTTLGDATATNTYTSTGKEDFSLASLNFSLAGQKGADTISLVDANGQRQELSLKRSMRRKKNKKKKSSQSANSRKTYVKGKVIDRKHELYTLSIAMMLGLRTSIYLTNDQIEDDKSNDRIWIESNDFMRVEKFVFRPRGGPKTPPHQLSHTFKFKDYSPLAFAYLRRMFGVNEYEFLQSVCGSANFIEFISNAKSGQFFFYSNDGKYMIKTMTNAESKFLRRILPHYFRHCAQNSNTLITKFFGMYRVKLYHLRRNVKFVIMNSVFDTDKPLQSFFDLKGSVIGRDAKPGEDVKKDNDVRKRYPDSKFSLPPTVRDRLKIQVERDCSFLQEMKIMDYSMLIGVHHITSTSSQSKSSNIHSSDTMIRGLNFRDTSSRAVQSNISSFAGAPITHQRSSSNPMKNTILSVMQRARSEGANKMNSNDTNLPKQPSILPTEVDEEHRKIGNFERKVEFDLDDEIKKKWLSSEVNLTENEDFKKSLASPMNPPHTSDRSLTSLSTIEGEEDDDDSYIGSEKGIRFQIDEATDSDLQKEQEQMKLRKEKAVEQIYWPFHRYYEISGQRRSTPLSVSGGYVEEEEDNDHDPAEGNGRCFGDPAAHDPDIKNARMKWKLPDFETPISNRKDKGLVMCTRGVQLPFKISNGSVIQNCDGKIFYMGIIDVLQQFNVRKRVEARYRSFGKNAYDASCVRPEVYAERFIRFFEEYTEARDILQDNSNNLLSSGMVPPSAEKETEEIVFSQKTDTNID